MIILISERLRTSVFLKMLAWQVGRRELARFEVISGDVKTWLE